MPKAAVLAQVGQPLAVREVNLEPPRAGEVQVRMAASGVCHSDLSVQNGTLLMPLPMVLGHEGAGVVEAVGEGVTDLAPGDHVVVSWVPQCGECYFCRRGQGELCERGSGGMVSGALLDGTSRFTLDGGPLFQMAGTGTFAERSVIPAIGAVKIPDDIPLNTAALMGCSVLTGVGAALNTATIRPGDSVAVVGCGGVGLNVVQGARIAGAERIIAVDLNETKLAMAEAFGATATVNAGQANAVSGVMDLTGQRGVDVAFEVIGLQRTIDDVVAMTRRGGQAVLVGVPPLDAVLHVPAFIGVVLMEKTFKGCWYGSANVHRDVPRLVDLHRRGDLKLTELISRTIALDEVNDAFAAMGTGEIARTVVEYGA